MQRKQPYRESFGAARTHLVILHLDGPVTVRRGEGDLSREEARGLAEQLRAAIAAAEG